MEAIQALQLQTDAKHRRITGQVMKSNNMAVLIMARTNSVLGYFLFKIFWNPAILYKSLYHFSVFILYLEGPQGIDGPLRNPSRVQLSNFVLLYLSNMKILVRLFGNRFQCYKTNWRN